jgi:hypothetical protein
VYFGADAHAASPCGVWVLASPLAAALGRVLRDTATVTGAPGPEDYERDSLVADLVSIVTAICEKPAAIHRCVVGG